MKVFRIVMVSFLGLVLVAGIGVYVFLKTLDVNKYLPMITAEVQKATGRVMTIANGRMVLGLNGIGVELKGIEMSDNRTFSANAFLVVDKMSIGVDVPAMVFEKKLQFTDITISRPQVTLIRNKNGAINAASFAPEAPSSGGRPASSAKTVSTGQEGLSAAPMPALMINDLRIMDASVTYVDEMFTPVLKVVMTKVDLDVDDLSLTDPFEFRVAAAIFSNDKDLTVKGKVKLDLASQSALIEQVKIEVDIARLSPATMTQELPMLAPAGLKGVWKGKLEVVLRDLKVAASGVGAMRLEAFLSGGRAETLLLPLPLENIEARAEGDLKAIELKDLTAQIAEGKISATGTVRDYMTVPALEMKGECKGADAAAFSSAYQLPVNVTGQVDADITFALQGKTPDEMIKSLRADINARLAGGGLKGVNLLKAALEKIPMLPGLWEMVAADLPPETRADMEKGVMVFDNCMLAAKMEGMTIGFKKAVAESRDLSFELRGMVALPEKADLKADLYIHPKVAAALIARVPDLESLRDEQANIYLPVNITGALAKPLVMPDIEYLSKKLLVGRGAQQLKKVLGDIPEVQGVLNSLFGAPKDGR